MNGLQMIKCEKCKTEILVGIDGKDIRKTKTSGGKTIIEGQKVPFMAIGNEELDKAPKLPDEVSCPTCGTVCKVKKSIRVE